jgi:hypothetical protein
MSKCQKNKYFIGSQCGPKTENKAFQQDFAKLMAARDAQDSQLQAPVKPVTTLTIKSKVVKSDIDTILEGDF